MEKGVLLVSDERLKGLGIDAEALATLWENGDVYSRYPRNDAEVRMWCLMQTMSDELDFEPKRFPNLQKAQELYDFICPSPKQEAQRT